MSALDRTSGQKQQGQDPRFGPLPDPDVAPRRFETPDSIDQAMFGAETSETEDRLAAGHPVIPRNRRAGLGNLSEVRRALVVGGGMAGAGLLFLTIWGDTTNQAPPAVLAVLYSSSISVLLVALMVFLLRGKVLDASVPGTVEVKFADKEEMLVERAAEVVRDARALESQGVGSGHADELAVELGHVRRILVAMENFGTKTNRLERHEDWMAAREQRVAILHEVSERVTAMQECVNSLKSLRDSLTSDERAEVARTTLLRLAALRAEAEARPVAVKDQTAMVDEAKRAVLSSDSPA